MVENYNQQLQTLNELLNQLWHINELSSGYKIRTTADSILSFAQNLNCNFLHDSILDDYLQATKKFPAENIPDDILQGIETRIRIIAGKKINEVTALLQEYLPDVDLQFLTIESVLTGNIKKEIELVEKRVKNQIERTHQRQTLVEAAMQPIIDILKQGRSDQEEACRKINDCFYVAPRHEKGNIELMMRNPDLVLEYPLRKRGQFTTDNDIETRGVYLLNETDIQWLKEYFPSDDGAKFSLSKIEVHLIQECKILPSIFKDLTWVTLLALLRNSESVTKKVKEGSTGKMKLSQTEVSLNEQLSTLTLNERSYDLTERGKELFQKLISANGAWVSGKQIHDRPDKTIKALSQVLQRLVESGRSGYRLKPHVRVKPV
jgi:hypothetical protein